MMHWWIVLFTIVLTVLSFAFSRWLAKIYPSPFTNTVLISTALIIVILLLTGLTTKDYEPGKKIMTFLLGPATAALAVPLYRNQKILKKHALAILLGIASGVLGIITTASLLVLTFQLGKELGLSMLPKSVTVPIAIEISRMVGGNQSLTAAFVVATGMAGSMLGPSMLTWVGVKNPLARGLAMGTTSHGQGTATALEEGEVQGAMAGVAMGLAAILTSFVAPLLAVLLFG